MNHLIRKNRIYRLCFFTLFFLYYIIIPVQYLDATHSDLIIGGTDVITIVDSEYLHSGNIVIKDNGTLVIESSKFEIYSTKDFEYNITIQDDGRLLLINGSLSSTRSTNLYLRDDGNLTIVQNSVVGAFRVWADNRSTFFVDSSTLHLDTLTANCQEISFNKSMVTGGFDIISNFAFVQNSEIRSGQNSFHLSSNNSIEILGDVIDCVSVSISSEATLTFRNSVLAGHNLFFSGNDSINVENSEFHERATISPSFVTPVLRGYNSIFPNPLIFDRKTPLVYLYNVTTPSITVNDSTKVFRYWWLTAHVTDSIGTPVFGANATVLFYWNNSIASSGITDDKGTVTIPLLSNIITAEKDEFVGNYLWYVSYQRYSSSRQSIAVDNNTVVYVSLPFIVDFLKSFLFKYIILGIVFTIPVLVLVIYLKMKRKVKGRFS